MPAPDRNDRDNRRWQEPHGSPADKAAEEAVRKVFAILGVDIDVPREVEEFRENLRFGATMRKTAERGWMAIIGVAATGALLALWAGVISKMTGKG